MKKGAFRFPMIKVEGGGGESPDPAVYCPANGYNTPPDPAVYCPANGYNIDPATFTTDEVIELAIDNPPSNDEITLIVIGDGDRHIYFRVTTSTGGYNVKIYDTNSVLLNSFDMTPSAYFLEEVPNTGAFFRYVISPTTGVLTSFRAYTRSGYDTDGANIAACIINAPSLTTCDQLFYNMKKLRYCEFISDCNLVTTFYRAFYNCESLLKVVMPPSTAVATLFTTMCYNTFALKEITLPTYMPLATNFLQAFYNSGITGTLTFPASMPNLTTLQSVVEGAIRLKKLVNPTSAPSLQAIYNMCRDCIELEEANIPSDASSIINLSYAFYKCNKLKGTFVFQELPACTTIAYAFYNCYEVTRIEFTGSMDLCTTVQYLAHYCKKVTHVILPESMEGLVAITNMSYVVHYCGELVHLSLPKYWNVSTTFTAGSTLLFASLLGCYKLAEITEVLNTNESQMGSLSLPNLFSLTSFNQPKIRPSSGGTLLCSPIGATDANSIRGALTYFQVDWQFLNNVINLNYNSIESEEALRILGSLSPKGNMGSTGYLSLKGNPCVLQLNARTWSGNGVIGNNTITVTAALGDLTGYSIDRLAISYGVTSTFNAAADTITLTGDHGFYTGRKIAITYSVLAIGVNYNVDYYVINPSGASFQIAETPGGAAVNILANTTGQIAFPVSVISMVGNTATLDCNLQTNSWSGWTFSPLIDYYELTLTPQNKIHKNREAL